MSSGIEFSNPSAGQLPSDISTNVSVGKTWLPTSLKSSEVHTSIVFWVWQTIWSLCCRKIFSFLWSKVVVAECFPTGESSNHCAQQQCSSEGGHCWPRYRGKRFFIQMIFYFRMKSFLLRSTAVLFRRWSLLLTKISRKEKAMMIFNPDDFWALLRDSLNWNHQYFSKTRSLYTKLWGWYGGNIYDSAKL